MWSQDQQHRDQLGLGPFPRAAESDTLGVGHSNPIQQAPSRWLSCMLSLRTTDVHHLALPHLSDLWVSKLTKLQPLWPFFFSVPKLLLSGWPLLQLAICLECSCPRPRWGPLPLTVQGSVQTDPPWPLHLTPNSHSVSSPWCLFLQTFTASWNPSF